MDTHWVTVCYQLHGGLDQFYGKLYNHKNLLVGQSGFHNSVVAKSFNLLLGPLAIIYLRTHSYPCFSTYMCIS